MQERRRDFEKSWNEGGVKVAPRKRKAEERPGAGHAREEVREGREDKKEKNRK